MRTILAFFLACSGTTLSAQGTIWLKPDQVEEPFGSFTATSIVPMGSGSYVAVGQVILASDGYNGRSYVTMFNCTNSSLASTRLDPGGFDVIRSVPGGGFIAAGSRSVLGNDQTYVCRFDAGLDTISTTVFDTPGIDKAFDVAVAPDGHASLVLITNGQAAVIRFAPDGTVLWSKLIPHAVAGPPVSMTIRVVVRGTETYVVGTERVGTTDDIFVRVLDASGQETLHRTYGSSTQHDDLRAVRVQGTALVILTKTGVLGERTGLIRLNSAFVPTFSMTFASGQRLEGMRMLTNNDGYTFIGGLVQEAGIEYSVVWQVWNDGTIGWKRKINASSSVSADMVFEGSSILVPTAAGSMPGMYLTYLNASTGFLAGSACEFGGIPVITNGFYLDMSSGPVALAVLPDAVFETAFGSTLTPFGMVPGNCGATLPAELTSFTAAADADEVRLDWTTATERNNHFFTVERSADGVDDESFEPVLRVASLGDSQHETYYVTADEHPLPGTSYYRLRQTDLDGTTTIVSEVVAVVMNASASGMVWPISEAYALPNGAVLLDQQGKILAMSGSYRFSVPGTYHVSGISGAVRLVVN